MKTLGRRQWRHFCVFIVNCERISHVILVVYFEQAKVCSIHVEKTNAFERKIEYIMPYAVVF